MTKIALTDVKLIGLSLKEKTRNENGQSTKDCMSLWDEFEKNNYAAMIPGKSSNELYGVYHDYEGDSSEPFAYFIGCKVNAIDIIPRGMQSLIIPAGTYYKFIAKGKMPECVINAWKEIWDIAIPRSYQVDFEVYDERSRDWNNGEVDVYVSVKEKKIGLGV